MSKTEEAVAKVRITFVASDSAGAVAWYLLSRKNAKRERNHGKLEMLGGHIETGETPLAGLIRELREEELTGILADHVARTAPQPGVEVVDAADHYLFDLRLPVAEFTTLIHDPRESLGFELVPLSQLRDGSRWDQLTWRTQRIIEAFGPDAW